jgi:hypothetical protein
MKPISQLRFDALAGYIRSPQGVLISREVEWYADDRERVLGVLALDRVDGDYGGVVLGRDGLRRFRAVSMSDFADSRHVASELLKAELREWSARADEDFLQGDEKGTPMDVFVPVAAQSA